jgi:hypothetical protein
MTVLYIADNIDAKSRPEPVGFQRASFSLPLELAAHGVSGQPCFDPA